MDLQRCIQDCLDCHRICLEMIAFSLRTGGEHAGEPHVRLLTDCAEICQTAANFMLRGSDLHGRICAACADVCARCADDCDRFATHEEMRRCVEVCRRCAESCRQIAA